MSTETDEFERALASQHPQDNYVLRLFVTGTNPRSTRAIQNIRAICDQILPGHFRLEVIDLYQHPERAGMDHIVVAPTLVKMFPLPVRHLIGDLSNSQRVLVGLDLVTEPAPDGA